VLPIGPEDSDHPWDPKFEPLFKYIAQRDTAEDMHRLLDLLTRNALKGEAWNEYVCVCVLVSVSVSLCGPSPWVVCLFLLLLSGLKSDSLQTPQGASTHMDLHVPIAVLDSMVDFLRPHTSVPMRPAFAAVADRLLLCGSDGQDLHLEEHADPNVRWKYGILDISACTGLEHTEQLVSIAAVGDRDIDGFRFSMTCNTYRTEPFNKPWVLNATTFQRHVIAIGSIFAVLQKKTGFGRLVWMVW
jgi:hypothetical protein